MLLDVKVRVWMVFLGRGFTSGEQEWVLPLVLKDERSCFSQGERFAVQLPFDRVLALQK